MARTRRQPDFAPIAAVFVVGALLVTPIAAAVRAHARGPAPDDFLNDLNSIGIGNRNDPHNFDLVGFGNAICGMLYDGDAPTQVAETLVAKSPASARLTPDQAAAAVSFAVADLCPDAASR